ncbi:MAG: S-layer homology domain-containing protein [Faecousia sp.]
MSYLGTKEYPAGSNNVVFNTHYYGREVSGSNYAWCGVFVWDIIRMAGAPELYYDGAKTAYVPALVSWGKKAGLIVPTKQAQYGDIVIFDWDHDGSGDHCGFVESVTNSGQYICIEGNTAVGNDSNGGEVMRRTRNASQILCVIRPQYDSAIVFDDVPESAWYHDAVIWAATNGLMVGVGGGKFEPDRAMTRAEVATVLQRLLAQ